MTTVLLPLILSTTTPPPDAMISGDWILKLIGALFTGAALLLGRYWGRREAAGVTLESPVPELPVRKVFTPPSFSQHQELVRRVAALEYETKSHREYVEAQLRDIRRESSEQFVKLMNAGEVRKDAIMESFREEMNRIYTRLNSVSDQLKKSSAP